MVELLEASYEKEVEFVKICIRCNEKFNEDYNFCPYCGTKAFNSIMNEDTSKLSTENQLNKDKKEDSNNIESIKENDDIKEIIDSLGDYGLIVKNKKILNIRKLSI